MIKVATAAEMQDIDRRTIERYGIAGIVLMERAGLAVADLVNNKYFNNPDRTVSAQTRKICVLCGPGNNGGDGFVVARILFCQGRDVDVYTLSDPKKLRGDALVNYQAARRFGLKIRTVRSFLREYSPGDGRGLLVIDAMLGTGLSRELGKPVPEVISLINALSCAVVAVDIPTGVSSDTGQVLTSSVNAYYTVTFGLPKRGHLIYPGAGYCGKLQIQDIGFPPQLLGSGKLKVSLTVQDDIAAMLPDRPQNAHKGTFGHVLLIAGSKGKTGAALMAARSCMRTGAGLVTIGIPGTLVNAFQSRVTEEMILPLSDTGSGTLSRDAAHRIIKFLDNKGDVLAIGPGLSCNEEIVGLMAEILQKTDVPVVIDADGLNALARNPDILKRRRSSIILTPHTGEMARLLRVMPAYSGLSERDLRAVIESDRITAALAFARKYKVVLVLKGAPSLIADPDGRVYINGSGNSGLASAGTGDVLTGVISSLAGQGMNSLDAAIAGVFLHGMAGDSIAGEKGSRSLIASDIIRVMPSVLKQMQV